MKPQWLGSALILVLLVAVMAPSAGAAPNAPLFPSTAQHSDVMHHPLGDHQAMLMAKALDAKLHGKATGKVHQVARGQYVELTREGEDKIWSILGEFGTQIDPVTGGTPGPLHNQIPEPDRSLDNFTIWAPDFNRAYFESLLFSEAPGVRSVRDYYLEQSSNRYTVNGDVSDWVQVPFNAAYYGTNLCGGQICSNTWFFVDDASDAWYTSQINAGKSAAEINAYLSPYDVWDRYDHDGDGDFDEPDGYLDHFQAIHAGVGEEAGGGQQGTDAIWSHKGYTYYNADGPDGSGPHNFGGIRIGDSDYWIGDYTSEPENGGIGIYAHEFGHDLGLPDLYDTSGNTGGAQNSTGFWTVYSRGSYSSSGIPAEGAGNLPSPMSALEKIQMGWSNYQILNPGQKASVRLGPANANTKQVQQLILFLPDKQVTFTIGPAFEGSYFYHSGTGNNLDNNMTRPISLGNGPITLSFQARYHIEACWDYAYVEVSTDGGASFSPIQTSASTNDNENGQNFGYGITGTSGTPKVCDQFGTPVWIPVTADLSPFAGQTIQLRFRYWTDPAVVGDGFGVDNIAITGLAPDGAETDPGWAYAGYSRTNGTTVQSFFNAYFAEYRTYKGYDAALKTGPYYFSGAAEWWLEHYPYQDGLLVWYYDTSFDDNNVGEHCDSGRCGGLYLPVDAHPELMIYTPFNFALPPEAQTYDSTFGLERTYPWCLELVGLPTQCYGNLPANPLFDDRQSYWVAPIPEIFHFGWASVPVPATGTTIRVKSVAAQKTFMQVDVNK